MSKHDFDDDESSDSSGGLHKEFQCPSCEAHNPYDEGFHVGDEVTCFYCGLVFEVRESSGKLKFREV